MTDSLTKKINDFVVSMPEMNRGFEIRMSTAGECVRKMDIEAQNGKPPVDAPTAFRLLTGEPIHQFWREILTRVFPDDYMYAEDELILDFEVDGVQVKVPGHLDGFIKSLNAVVEVKSVSESTFKMVKNQDHPLGSHYEQGNIYAEAIEAHSILFIYHNRNSGEYCLFLSPHSDAMAQGTITKWATVIRNRSAGVTSTRPYHDATGSPCFYCPHKISCYEGYTDQIKNMSATEIKDPKVTDMAQAYVFSRRMKLDHTKHEETVKAAIAAYMFENKFNDMRIPDVGAISLKAGKNNNPLISIKLNKGDSE